MGFNRPSDDTISNLLQKYNSVEEAFQDLNPGESEDDTDRKLSSQEALMFRVLLNLFTPLI